MCVLRVWGVWSLWCECVCVCVCVCGVGCTYIHMWVGVLHPMVLSTTTPHM